MMWRIIFVFLFSFVATIPPVAESFSQDSVAEIESMKGVEGVGIRIDEIDATAVSDGLNRDKILSSVSNELKKAGIKVLTSEESAAVEGKPSLYITINTIKHEGGVYSFTVGVSFDQLVMLVRNQKIKVISPTWSVLGTGASLPEDLGANVEKYVLLMVQKFIDDFKKANSE